MIEPLLTGFLLGSSLIIAIGPQNIFVLRQGLIKKHVFLVAAFCSISDVILIFIGIGGMSLILSNVINNYSDYLFGISAIWLTIYAFTRFISAIKSKKQINIGPKPLQKDTTTKKHQTSRFYKFPRGRFFICFYSCCL